MPEVMGKRSGIVAVIGKLVAGRMAQHMGMDREGKPRSNASALNHSQEPSMAT